MATVRSAAILAAAGLLGFTAVCDARPSQGGRSSGGHFSGGHFSSGRIAAPAARFHAVPRFHAAPHFAPRFHPRVIVGGALIAPLYFGAPYYYPPPPAYYAPP